MIKFQGILGNVCGIPVPFAGTGTDTESVRLKAKGFVFNDGIETLRGFAKIGDLYKASKKDTYYQREHESTAGEKHIAEIKEFLTNGKAQAKFLPEVILVGRAAGYNKTKLLAGKGINPTAQGEIDNLDLYSIEVEDGSLYRVDGNHRLEAGKDLHHYVSFAIILWAQSTTAKDDEAFLFYFLNGKAKQLTPEENYRALVSSEIWSPDEIKKVNPILPYLKQFNKLTDNALFRKTLFKNTPLTQIAHIISEINDFKKSPEEYAALIGNLNEILPQEQLFPYLKANFDHILPQLIFYVLYQSATLEEAKGLMKRINDWAKHFNYTEGSFDNPVKLYEVAKKQLDIEEVGIFIAMPYYAEEIVKQYNTSFENVVNKIKLANPHLKLNKFPIMTHEGSSIELIRDIIEKIKVCSIFIADITGANPNVMYELGLAKSLDKKIIILRKDSETEPTDQKVPLDIITLYRETYNPLALGTMEKKTEKNIRAILINEMGKPLSE